MICISYKSLHSMTCMTVWFIQIKKIQCSIFTTCTVISMSQLDSKFKFSHPQAVICGSMGLRFLWHARYLFLVQISYSRGMCALAHMFLWSHAYVSMSCSRIDESMIINLGFYSSNFKFQILEGIVCLCICVSMTVSICFYAMFSGTDAYMTTNISFYDA